MLKNLQTINLVILDLKMPDKSGFDIINNTINYLNCNFNNLTNFPKTIVITALFNNLTLENIENIKNNNNLENKLFSIFKPINIDLLKDIIIKIIVNLKNINYCEKIKKKKRTTLV